MAKLATKTILTRRQVLRGAGGFTIGLPLLPSLVAAPAFAQVSLGSPKYFVALATGHGGIRDATMYPTGGLDQTTQLYPEHPIKHSTLTSTSSGGRTVISGILQASSGVLTPKLVAKMNVLRGLDVPWYIAHNTGGHLGNYARNDGNGGDGMQAQAFPTPTIDQLMAYSTNFYPTLNGLKSRTINTGVTNQLSFNFSNPANRTGSIQPITLQGSPSVLFKQLFIPGGTTAPPTPTRKSIVDRVMQNYKSLRESNRRLSRDDRQRLDEHMTRLTELQRLVDPVVGGGMVGASCGTQTDPGNLSGTARYKGLNDVIVMAFACGTSRIAVMGVNESEFAANRDNWHQGVAHLWNTTGQPQLVEANQGMFENVFADLIAKLDAVQDSPGVSLLDASLVQWTQESGEATHDADSRPTVTAGSARGYLKTGLYVDYRNMTARGKIGLGNAGLTHNQYMTTAMYAMGMKRAEFQTIPNVAAAGYGWGFSSNDYKPGQVPQVMANASDPMPIITA